MITRAAKIVALFTICGLFAVSVCAGVVAQTQANADPVANVPTAQNQFAILITTIAGFASLLCTQLFQFYRENRNRRWDLQDRTAAREQMRKTVEEQRMEGMRTAVELAKVSQTNRDLIFSAIKENTTLTVDAGEKAQAAYTSANNFNSKLETLHRELIAMSTKLSPDKSDQKET
jgi:hypothetical protein